MTWTRDARYGHYRSGDWTITRKPYRSKRGRQLKRQGWALYLGGSSIGGLFWKLEFAKALAERIDAAGTREEVVAAFMAGYDDPLTLSERQGVSSVMRHRHRKAEREAS